MKSYTLPPSLPPVASWHIVMVAGCNLRCGYCVTGHGTFGSAGGVMEECTAEKLAEWIVDTIDPGTRATSVSFGGGETFSHFTRFLAFADLIDARCRERGAVVAIHVATNGVLLDEVRLQQLAKRRIGLGFSIDGPEPLHDALRQDAAGRATFQAAFANWSRYRELADTAVPPISCRVSSVFGPHGGSVREVADFWIRQGLKLVDLKPVTPTRFDSPAQAEAARRARLACLEGFESWALDQAGHLSAADFLSFYRGPLVVFAAWRRFLMEQERYPCTPARGVLAVGHDGSFYPCDAYVGLGAERIGDVWNGIGGEELKRCLSRCAAADALCSECPTRKDCEKSCKALIPTVSPLDNLARECAGARTTAAMLRRSFELLMSR